MFGELNRWADYLSALGRADGTIRRYRYAVIRFCAETPKDSLAEVDDQDVVVFLASLGKRAHSKMLYLQALRSFFGYLHGRGEIDHDPTALLKPKSPPEPDADAYSPEELERILEAAAARGEHRAQAMLVAYALGLRRSELCGITPDDVDWSGRRVHIRNAKGGRPRWVEANDIAMAALDALRPKWNGTVVGGIDPQTFTAWVNEAARDSGLPPGRRKAHMLRASFATHLLAEGVPISIVSKLLGHAKVSTTSRYLAVRDEDRRAAVAKLPTPGRGGS